ncbi:MAG TPA: hypothetical protein VLG12_06270 [Candidatus Saccharimonadales bacterium]|nr:hypothetical protein [Candidatus Saccharimonadales bacterium]
MIEFLSVIAIIIFLTGFITFNLTRTQQHTSTNTTIDALVTDIKQQQLKAMIQDTQGNGVVDAYGIYFQSTKYTLFKGTVYSSSDTTNFTVNLDTNLQFTNIAFPSTSIIFAKGSGEVTNFTAGQNTIQIKNISSNEVKTITINKYGTITSVN